MSVNNIVEVDIRELTQKIAEKDEQISLLQKEREKMYDLLEYINSHYVKSIAKTDELSQNVTLENSLTALSAEVLKMGLGGGISEALLSYLKNFDYKAKEGTTIRRLATLYGKAVGKNMEDVYGNVANALSRLKVAGRVGYKDGASKGVSEWYFIK